MATRRLIRSKQKLCSFGLIVVLATERRGDDRLAGLVEGWKCFKPHICRHCRQQPQVCLGAYSVTAVKVYAVPVASLQYLRERNIVASDENLRQHRVVASNRNLRKTHPLFQARLTAGLARPGFFATDRVSSRPVRSRICLDRAPGLMRLNAAFMLMIGRLRIFSCRIAR